MGGVDRGRADLTRQAQPRRSYRGVEVTRRSTPAGGHRLHTSGIHTQHLLHGPKCRQTHHSLTSHREASSPLAIRSSIVSLPTCVYGPACRRTWSAVRPIPDVKVPVRWWHDDSDPVAPIAGVQPAVSRLQDGELSLRSGESHLRRLRHGRLGSRIHPLIPLSRNGFRCSLEPAKKEEIRGWTPTVGLDGAWLGGGNTSVRVMNLVGRSEN